ncbi:MAG: hypothetical protein J6Y43_02200, partial [Clostridia bacterium]|nr:hypothetical protein [Clostridia bacterium]
REFSAESGTERINVETENVKCPGCGANMIFDADLQMLYCPHCGSKKELGETRTAQEQDLMAGLSADSEWKSDETVVFRCENCGVKVVLAKSETAKTCPFCGTAHVQKTVELAGLKPDAVLPFTFGHDKALEFSKEWARKRFFAPRKFKKNLSPENVNGVYTPCFTFDSHTYSTYQGRIGKTHTRTVGSGKNRRTETYTVWRNISGTFSDFFDDIAIAAGDKCGQKQLDKISPYDTNSSKENKEQYLLGFMAYHYDYELSSCWNVAKSKMDAIIKQRILAQYTYDKVDYLNVSTTHEGVKYKYVMLPVYVGNFTFRQKLYNFFVNGTTGRTYGKYPKSGLKIGLLVLLGLAAAAVIAYFCFIKG